LNKQGQAIEAQKEATQLNLAGMANAQSQRISGLLASPLDLSGGPQPADVSGMANVMSPVTSYSSGGPIQGSLNMSGVPQLQTTYGPADNFSADRQRVEDALMARMNPQLAIQKQQLQQQLADQGIRYGSQAYTD